MIDRVDFKKYVVPRNKTLSGMIAKDIEIYKIDFEIKDIRLVNKFRDCDGCNHVEVMYLLKNK